MCGIAGFVSVNPLSGAREVVRRMSDALAHRGPDDSGIYVDSFAAFGHRRLSIIDLATGHQPMTNETGTLQIVYNGEIFNHSDLRQRLEKYGHRYSTHSDTETILHAYEEWGTQCVDSFHGMFAFTIWDCEKRILFCARDRLGKKPFYYFWDGTLFAFASEIKALLKHPNISATFNSDVLPEYLAAGYSSSEHTFFRGIRKLTPGHYLTLDVSGGHEPVIRQYWDVPRPALADAPPNELIRETRRRLEETVQSRLMSDVPLGVFLSGGVDSSAIAAITARLRSDRIQTFSVGYSESRFSELDYARKAAAFIGADYHEVTVSKQQFFDALPQLVWHEDEPITWPSSVPLYFVSKLAARQVKVVLTGEGSDELFGGYERYRWNLWNVRAAAVYGHVPRFARKWLADWVSGTNLIRGDIRRKLSHTFLARDSSMEALYLDNFYSAFSCEQQGQLLSSGSPHERYLSYLNAPGDGTSLLSRMLYADQKTYLVELLMKQDQMSMAASIESRVPLLDHHLVAFAASIPDSLKISGTVQKYIFKKAIEDLLPGEIVYRKKMGFPTPLKAWLREESTQHLYGMLLDRSSFTASTLERKPVERLIERHRNGQEDGTDRIWRLLNLELWGRIFITGNGTYDLAGVLEAARSSR